MPLPCVASSRRMGYDSTTLPMHALSPIFLFFFFSLSAAKFPLLSHTPVHHGGNSHEGTEHKSITGASQAISLLDVGFTDHQMRVLVSAFLMVLLVLLIGVMELCWTGHVCE